MQLQEISNTQSKEYPKKSIDSVQKIINALGDNLIITVIDGGLVAYNYWGDEQDNNTEIEICYNPTDKLYHVDVRYIPTTDSGRDYGYAKNIAELEALYHKMRTKYSLHK